MEVIKFSLIKRRLNSSSFRDFEEFINGQTVGISSDGDTLVYAHDFLRWWKSFDSESYCKKNKK